MAQVKLIQVGDNLPRGIQLPRYFARIGQPAKSAVCESLFSSGRVVVFGVPGAFTSTCSQKHVPSFIEHAAEFKRLGFTVYCLSVNDGFVMARWSDDFPSDCGVHMVGDGNGAYCAALGVLSDKSGGGFGHRCDRFAMIAVDGLVKYMEVEDAGCFIKSEGSVVLQKAKTLL